MYSEIDSATVWGIQVWHSFIGVWSFVYLYSDVLGLRIGGARPPQSLKGGGQCPPGPPFPTPLHSLHLLCTSIALLAVQSTHCTSVALIALIAPPLHSLHLHCTSIV